MQKEEKELRSLGEDGNRSAARIRGKSKRSSGASRATRATDIDFQ